MDENPVNSTSTKTRNVGGAPFGSRHALKHGVYSLERPRARGGIDRRTSPYRAIKKIEREIAAKQTESRKRWHRDNAAKLQYYVQRIDEHLLTLKSIMYKGRVHPSIELRLRLSEAVERNYGALDAVAHKDQPLDLARRLMTEKKA
jgi:hypothetical protein